MYTMHQKDRMLACLDMYLAETGPDANDKAPATVKGSSGYFMLAGKKRKTLEAFRRFIQSF